MVYIVGGKIFEGHKPKSGDTYERSPSVFADFSIEAAQKRFSELEAEEKLYLYVAAACPWAHRASLARAVLGLEDCIELSVVEPIRDDKVGWAFRLDGKVDKYDPNLQCSEMMNPTADKRGTGFKYLHQVYLQAVPDYTGNVTTPLLIDSKGRILSNQSWDIARALVVLSGDDAANNPYYPIADPARCLAIDQIAKQVQTDVNNGVYRAGLAKTQKAYEEAVNIIFAAIKSLEVTLGQHRFLLPGEEPTVADWQLFATLCRFDDVYGPLFKCLLRRLSTYSNIYSYVCDMAQWTPAVVRTLHPRHTMEHYYHNFTSSNPNKVVPLGTKVTHMLKFQHNRQHMALKQAEGTPTRSRPGSHQQNQSQAGTSSSKGAFVRGVSGFRNWVEPGGKFDVEGGRYHLYVSNNCPWCHRVLLGRAVMGLEDAISVDLLFYRREEATGFWQFLPQERDLRPHERGGADGNKLLRGVATVDSVNGKRLVPEIYQMFGSAEKSVPILFDKKLNTIVNNESSEILRMLGTVFAPLRKGAKGATQGQKITVESTQDAASETAATSSTGSDTDSIIQNTLYPPAYAWLVEEINEWVYQDIANGAYRAGFSSNQQAHNEAASKYFDALQRANDILSRRRFLCGEFVTEADIRLFPPIFRHDPVYYSRMKLTAKMIIDYPHLQRWLETMMHLPGVESASSIDHCLHGYFGRTGTGLVPTVVLGREGRFY